MQQKRFNWTRCHICVRRALPSARCLLAITAVVVVVVVCDDDDDCARARAAISARLCVVIVFKFAVVGRCCCITSFHCFISSRLIALPLPFPLHAFASFPPSPAAGLCHYNCCSLSCYCCWHYCCCCCYQWCASDFVISCFLCHCVA